MKELLNKYERLINVLNKYMQVSIKWGFYEVTTLKKEINGEKLISIFIKLRKNIVKVDRFDIVTFKNISEIELNNINTSKGEQEMDKFIRQIQNRINYIKKRHCEDE